MLVLRARRRKAEFRLKSFGVWEISPPHALGWIEGCVQAEDLGCLAGNGASIQEKEFLGSPWGCLSAEEQPKG